MMNYNQYQCDKCCGSGIIATGMKCPKCGGFGFIIKIHHENYAEKFFKKDNKDGKNK